MIILGFDEATVAGLEAATEINSAGFERPGFPW